MQEVSTFRLCLLRATYLVIAVGLALMIWPRLIHHTNDWALKNGDAAGLLAGIQVLAMLGIRYPVKMIPLLLFELTWKSIWLLAIALPLWQADHLDAGTRESINACGFGVVICLVALPWPYMFRTYILARGDRWRMRAA